MSGRARGARCEACGAANEAQPQWPTARPAARLEAHKNALWLERSGAPPVVQMGFSRNSATFV